ncbi:hypothetical protein [Pseudooceanicola batsensis]|uniref:hypothetical protein n=1 Tax=Pseudooceanicola batsensis TaxID=314255 RepID=UPI0011D2B4BE|nr:hypothetical protein [Pseudooceanicola batsensis]
MMKILLSARVKPVFRRWGTVLSRQAGAFACRDVTSVNQINKIMRLSRSAASLGALVAQELERGRQGQCFD